VVLADLNQNSADAAAEVLANRGFRGQRGNGWYVRESVHGLIESTAARGNVTGVIHAAGLAPSQAEPQVILAVDLYGTALVLEEFGNVVARGGAGVVIASQSGHRLAALTAEEDKALATTPTEEQRGRNRGSPPHGCGRGVHHGTWFPDGRWSYCVLFLRRPCRLIHRIRAAKHGTLAWASVSE
jgi:hypothetical protein